MCFLLNEESLNADLPSFPHLAGFYCIFLALPHLALIFKIRLPAFSETCYSFSLRNLFFLKTYIISLKSTFKRAYFQSFFALLSCVVARSLKYRLAHSKTGKRVSWNILTLFYILGLDGQIIVNSRIMEYF